MVGKALRLATHFVIRRLARLNQEMTARTDVPWPTAIEIGIGLNAGPCCVGNMGTEQRLSYSLIGDTVNLASRLEGLTKQYGVRIAMGEALASRIEEFALLEMDRVRVVGRDRPETVFVLVGDEVVAGSVEFQAFHRAHRRILADYRARRWAEALRGLEAQAEAAQAYGLSRVYRRYVEKAQAYAVDPPPPDWDAVSSAQEK